MNKLSILFLVVITGCVGTGTDPDEFGSDDIGSVSEALAPNPPKTFDWNSCYITSEDYNYSYPNNYLNHDPGGPICIEQWGSFATACSTACDDEISTECLDTEVAQPWSHVI